MQQTHRWDDRKKRLVPKFDTSSAEEYGELVYLLGPNAGPFVPETVLPELHRKLADVREEDYLLLIGNPALISFVACVAADYLDGRLRLLQWSNGKYVPIVVDDVFSEKERT